jgi:hypothetical protein
MCCAIIHGARGDKERAREMSTTPLSVVRSARRIMRQGHVARPWLTPMRCTDSAPYRDQGHLGGHTREEKRHNRFKIRAMQCPPADPIFASHYGLATTGCSSEAIDMTTYERNRERADSR